MLPRTSFAAILGLVAAALGATTTLEVWDQSAGVGKMEKSRVWYGDGRS